MKEGSERIKIYAPHPDRGSTHLHLYSPAILYTYSVIMLDKVNSKCCTPPSGLDRVYKVAVYNFICDSGGGMFHAV